jgi:WD40 repeat protein
MIVVGISKKNIVSTLDPQILDASTGKVIAQFPKMHQSLINNLSLSQDGSLLLTSSGDGLIVLWDIKSRKVKTKIDSKIPFLSKAVLSSDGSLIAASKTVWDATSGEVVATPPPGLFNPHTFVPGKHSLLYYNENENSALSLWDVDSGETKTIFKQPLTPIAFDLQNGFLYLSGTGGMLLKIPFSP